jgi:hypothetical protein
MTRKPTVPPSVNSIPDGQGETLHSGANAEADPPADPKVAGDSPDRVDTPAPGPDPFDPASLRLSQDLSVGAGVQKAILKIPVRKPSKGAFCRAHLSDAYRIAAAVIDPDDGNREVYLVPQALQPALATEPTLKPVLLVAAIDRQGVLFLWPAGLPKGERDCDAWSSMRKAIDAATRRWVRVTWSDGLRAYEVSYPTADLGEPNWPDLTFSRMLGIAFKDRLITTLDHPILRRLRGEV